MKDPFGNLTADQKRILRESFVAAFGKNGSHKRKQVVKETVQAVGTLLRQEYKLHRGKMWLWTMGKPVRPLTEEEIAER